MIDSQRWTYIKEDLRYDNRMKKGPRRLRTKPFVRSLQMGGRKLSERLSKEMESDSSRCLHLPHTPRFSRR